MCSRAASTACGITACSRIGRGTSTWPSADSSLGTRPPTRAGRHPGGHRLSGSLSRPDRTVVARLSPVSRRADAARRRPGRHRASPRDSGFVMTAHRSTSTRAYFTAASTRVRRRVRVASTTPARAALPHPTVGSAPPTPGPPPGHNTCPRPASDDRIPIDGYRCGFVQPGFCLPSRRWSVGLTPAPSRRGATQKTLCVCDTSERCHGPAPRRCRTRGGRLRFPRRWQDAQAFGPSAPNVGVGLPILYWWASAGPKGWSVIGAGCSFSICSGTRGCRTAGAEG